MADSVPPSVNAPASAEGGAVSRHHSGVLRLRRTARITWTWSRRLLWLGIWFAVSLVAATTLFLTSSRETTLAGHSAVLRPSLGEWAQVRSGPLLPDLRLPSGAPVGVSVELGKTSAASPDELLQRYALLAAHPDAQVHKIRDLLVDMLLSSLLRGAALGLVPIALWVLLGPRRRRELLAALRTRKGAVGGAGLALIVVAVWQPWTQPEPTSKEAGTWTSLGAFVGPDVALPSALGDVQIFADATTSASKRLVESMVDTYEKSKTFYDAASERAASLELRQPEEGETVALLVSDRHDNVGMDQVARAIGEAGGATAILDAGDDTSTGSDWEAFSLDSLADTFRDWDRWVAVGNHDTGTFVSDYLADRGWVPMDGSVTVGPGGVSMLGAPDPRSSGLGSWRDEGKVSFGDVRANLADTACAAEGGRVELMLVHDANLGKEALARGCVGLVVGGHVHVQNGPDRVLATEAAAGTVDAEGTAGTQATGGATATEGTAGPTETGSTTAADGAEATDGSGGTNGSGGADESGASAETHGFTYTNGTTGGAAFGIAVGSKPKREAQVSLITFRDGRAVGIQPISVRTDGKFVVADWTALDDSLPLG